MTSRKFKIYLIFFFTTFMLMNPINLQSVKSKELITNSNFHKQSNTVSTLMPNSIENETLLAHHMKIKVNNDYSLKVTSTYVVTNNDSQPMDFFAVLISKNISSVFSYDPIGSLSFTWLINITTGSLVNVSMRYPLFPNETYVFSIEYRIDTVIYSVQEPIEYYGLDFEITHPRKTDLFELELCLPSESDLLDQSPPEPVYPNPLRIVEEDGIVKIYWVLENRDMDDDDVFLIRFVTRTSDIPNDSNLKPLFYILTLLAGILLGCLVIFLVYRFKVKPAESQLVSSLLTKTEQEVIKAINQDGGVSTQRRICEKTGYSKSKVSQILLKLEQRDVLVRERWGRTNKVTITAPTFKTIGVSNEKPE
ncbi:MAG: winged helix-turn-helix transcriptional regulator [Candidatus Heimdallarchaeota archaeon]|nr:winged helix-turn-helix transcriptional regulator [Candidatus Heimdallarchaeota archaeon]MBY8995457.1 winged helix-turn-helix transcriptional regulator [Candidatus Heimdallarchaeota archaeon]